MSSMNALTPVLLLLSVGVNSAEVKSQCSILLNVESVMYAGTKNETIDSITVCNDGKVTAFHSFTAPALGSAKEEPTKWDYRGQIGKEAVSDLQKLLRRTGIAHLPERVNIVKIPSPTDVLMRFTITNPGQLTITLHAPMRTCVDERPEMPSEVWDLMCVFIDLYNRAKTGAPSENSCGCKPLHKMVKGHSKSEIPRVSRDIARFSAYGGNSFQNER